MNFYQKHVFFCINQKENGKKCCEMGGADAFADYTKQKLQDLKCHGAGQIRVSKSGCMGRCKSGPGLVVYPEGVWYRYSSQADIDRIIEQHLLGGKVVEALLME